MTRGQIGGIIGIAGGVISATCAAASFFLKLSDVGYEKQQREAAIDKAVTSYLDAHPEKIINN